MTTPSMTKADALQKLRAAFPDKPFTLTSDQTHYANGAVTSELVLWVGKNPFYGTSLRCLVETALAEQTTAEADADELLMAAER